MHHLLITCLTAYISHNIVSPFALLFVLNYVILKFACFLTILYANMLYPGAPILKIHCHIGSTHVF